MDHTNQTPEAVPLPQSTATPNWTTNVSYVNFGFKFKVRTIKVSNISLAASKTDITEFFSFSGDIRHVEVQRENENTQVAYVTFKDPKGADTAMLLTGARIVDLFVTITPVENYQLPPEALPTSPAKNQTTGSAVQKAEDVVSTMLAKGFILGKDAMVRAKSFDEHHQLSSNASAKVASIDRKMGISDKLNTGTTIVNEKMKEMDEKYQVIEKTKSALAVAEQKASSTKTALMSNPYVMTGASWVSNAITTVAKVAEDVSTMTKEKVELAKGEKEIIYANKTRIVDEFGQMQFDESSAKGLPVVPVNSSDESSAKDPPVLPVNSSDESAKGPPVVPINSSDESARGPPVVPASSNDDNRLANI